MKHIFLFVTILFLFTSSIAQSGARQPNFICSYYGDPLYASTVMGFASTADAKTVISRILSVVGLEPSFEIRSANIPNAAAIISAGKRYILYNPQFIADIDRATGSNWASIAILAHEIGHHLNGHTLLGSGSQPRLELEADEFSGFVLQKMGASLPQAQSAMKVAANIRATTTHPAKEDRLTAIAEGWYKANNQAAGRNDVASVPATTTPRVETPSTQTVSRPATTSNNRYILYDVRFNADQRAAYYVTTQNQLVTLKGNQLVVIGKLERTNNRSYPFRISDERTSLFVSAQGSIVTSNGQQVGIMKNHS